MFRKQFACVILVWLLSVFACFWFLHDSSAEAELAYQRLMSMSDQTKKEHAKQEEEPVQQTRYEVGKQMICAKEGKRMQSRLSSDKSELVFDQQAGKGDFVEHFTRLTCAMQEKPLKEGHGQHLRLLKARQATYSYKSGQLDAQEVALSDYLIPGEQWPVSLDPFTPFLQGEAEKVNLSLFKEPSLKAEGFQATLYDWEGGK